MTTRQQTEAAHALREARKALRRAVIVARLRGEARWFLHDALADVHRAEQRITEGSAEHVQTHPR